MTIVDECPPSSVDQVKDKDTLATNMNNSPSSGHGTRLKQQLVSQEKNSDVGSSTNKDDNLDVSVDEQPIATRNQLGPTLRSSARAQKPPRRDDSPPPMQPPPKKQAKVVTTSEQVRTRRSWEMWSVEDKKTFFEALCEMLLMKPDSFTFQVLINFLQYGKDFESIQNYIAQKNKKKGHSAQLIKNKDQVRQFYYRTWHKIAKYLDISSDVKKQTQELYGLINYGELRKKICGRLDEKNGIKLNELVHKGATAVRYKGKNLRVKTPLCRALKRLNNVEEPKEDEQPKLPTHVTLELRPHTNSAWAHVQSLSQNPRIRLTLTLQRRLATVIEYLQHRWRSHMVKYREQLLVNSGKSEEENDKLLQVLRLIPHADAHVTAVNLKPGVEISSASVSLQNYRERVLCENGVLLTGNKKSSKSKTKNNGNSSSANGKMGYSEVANGNAVTLISNAINSEDAKMCGEESNVSSFSKGSVALAAPEPEISENTSLPAHEVTLRHLLALETAADPQKELDLKQGELLQPTLRFLAAPETRESEKMKLSEIQSSNAKQNTATQIDDHEKGKGDHITELKQSPNDSIPVTGSIVEVEKLLQGWTAAEAGSLTIGEVYLMLGQPPKVVLDYEWVTASSELNTASTLPQASDVHGVLPIPSQDRDSPQETTAQQLALVLNKLVQLAATRFSDIKLKQEKQAGVVASACSCSHICSGSPSSNKSASTKSTSTVRSSSSKSNKNHGSKHANAALSSSSSMSSINTEPPEGAPAPLDTTTTSLDPQRNIFLKPTSIPPHSRILAKDGLRSLSSSSKFLSPENAFKEQLDKLLPPHRKARSRVRNSVVVQRELPLLPKTNPTHSVMTLQIVPTASQLAGSFMPVIPNANLAAGVAAAATATSTIAKVVKFAPAITSAQTIPCIPVTAATTQTTHLIASPNLVTIPATKAHSAFSNSSSVLSMSTTMIPSPKGETVISSLVTNTLAAESSVVNVESNINSLQPSQSPCVSTSAQTTTISIPELHIAESVISTARTTSISPPSISSLLDISLTAMPSESAGNVSETLSGKMLDFTLDSSCTFTGLISLSPTSTVPRPSTGGLLGISALTSESIIDPTISTTSTSTSPPHHTFNISSPSPENQWLGGDGVEFSLSSLLGQLESPIKSATSLVSSTAPPSEPMTIDPYGRLSSDVDSHLQCIMSENSVDYISKFADLAAHIESSDILKKV